MKNVFWWLLAGAAAYGFAKYRAYKGLQYSIERWQLGNTFDGPGFFVTMKIFNGGLVTVGLQSLTGKLLLNGQPVGDVRIIDRFSIAPGATETVTASVANLSVQLASLLSGASGLQLQGRALLPMGITVNFLENVS